jgi:antagonist of KipI
MSLALLNAGFQTTIQDLGRYGYLRAGIPPSGPMDRDAFVIANRLVGNDDNAAELECAFLGPRLECRTDAWVAVTGAEVDLRINGKLEVLWTALRIRPGDVIQIGPARNGCWAYLAISGGIDVHPVLGSRSTYVRGSLGGTEGRALKNGDVLPVGTVLRRQDGLEGRQILSQYKPSFPAEVEVRVILGPQQDCFTSDGIETFLSSAYEVTHKIDRMGYRLKGAHIAHRTGPDIISDGIPAGAIQVPGDGQPMILLVDRQSTGGYSKIATVISVDIGVVAQTGPGRRIRFRSVTVMEAHHILRQAEVWLTKIIQAQL